MKLSEFKAKIEGMDIDRYRKARILQWVAELELPMEIVMRDKYIAYEVPAGDGVPVTDEMLLGIWHEVWPQYSPFALTLHKKVRSYPYPQARTHFARLVKMRYPFMTTVQLGKFMQKDHTTILHYWYKAGYNCNIPPLNDKTIIKHGSTKQGNPEAPQKRA